MARKVLTDKFLKSASKRPAPSGKRLFYGDALVPSLYFRVTDKGHCSWLLQRRVNGKMTYTTFGDWPAIPLKDARTKAKAALEEMEKGRIPAQVEKVIKATVQRSNSFEAAIEDYLKREVSKRRERTQQEITRPLRKVYIPKWGSLALAEIKPKMIIDALDERIDAGFPVQANRDRSILLTFFGWCVGRLKIETNPVTAVPKPTDEKSRDRVLADDELREVWKHAGSLRWPYGAWVQALIMTGQRRTEVALMTRAQINSKARVWNIPAEIAKNNYAHAVPISAALQSILDAAPSYDGQKDTDPIFSRDGRPISGFSDVKQNLDELLKAADVDLKPWVWHTLKHTLKTWMQKARIPKDVRNAVQNHHDRDMDELYGHYTFELEKRDALDRWSRHIETISGETESNVVELAAVRAQ